MPEKYIIAVDLGTSAARAVLFDLSAKPLRVVRQPYSLLAPQPGWSEQDPEEVVKAVVACLREIAGQISQKNEILCVTFSSQMYSLLALDQQNQPVTNSITWNDHRGAEIAELLKGSDEFRKLSRLTGCPISEIFPIYKILWLKQNLGGFGALKFVSIKDYVIARLTGRLISDWSVASATGLLNLNTKQWDEDTLSFVGLHSQSNLPEVVSPRYILERWTGKVSDIGIPGGTPIVLGGGDAPLSSFGIGAVHPGSATINVGTSAALRVTVDIPYLDQARKLWTFAADEGLWVTGGITGGGIVYDWLIRTYFHNTENLSRGQIYRRVDELVQTVAPGSDGLLFIPYISGEQSPGWNAKQRGGFIGLGVEHGVAHFSRAALEGLAFSLYRIANTLDSALPIKFDRIYMSGGLTSSDVWLQLASDVFGCNIFAQENTEGSAKGSMILASLALGLIAKPGELSRPDAEYKIFSVNEDNHKVYQSIFRRFENVLGLLQN